MRHLILLTLLIVGCGEYEKSKGVDSPPPVTVIEQPSNEEPQPPIPEVVIDDVSIDVALDIVLDKEHNGLTCVPKKHKKKYTGKYKCTSSLY